MLSGLDLGIFAGFLAAVLGLGLAAARRRREGLDDFFLAGRTLTLPSFVATLVPTWFGGVLGVGEFTYRFGVSNWLVQGVPYYVFGLLYAWLLAGRVRGASGRTLPDHLEAVYGPGVAIAAAVWIALLASPADEMLMLGTVARWLTDWPAALCVAGAGVFAFSILWWGGLRADVWTNRLEFLFMYGGFALVIPAAWMAVGGAGGLAARLPAAHLVLGGGHSVGYLLTWFFIALWTFVDPAFHQRVCAAADARTARVGICVSVAFWFLFDLMTTTAGLCARALTPEMRDPLMAYPELASRLLPPVLKGLFFAGMSSSIIASLAAAGLVSATALGKDAAGRIWDMPPEASERWIRWGLLASGAAGWGLAVVYPSVVSLWFFVGSAAVPGLLLVTLSVYFEPLRMTPRGALSASVGGGSVALAWLALGLLRGSAASPSYPLGVEPFYAGLACSAAAWAVGRERRAAQRAAGRRSRLRDSRRRGA